MRYTSPTTREHIQGVILLLLVSLLWVFTAVLVQQVFAIYPKPYLLSLVSSTTFTVLLLLLPFRRPIDKRTKTTGARLVPLFFATIYTYNLGLAYTTVSSSSTISTLTTLFALALGAFLGTDPLTIPRVAGTAITILGVAIIGSDDGTHRLTGDLLTLVSAFTYALYGVVLKTASAEYDVDVSIVQGFMGFFTALVGVPVLALLHITGIEDFVVPSVRVVGLLLLNGFGGTFIAEVLYARSVVLTSPMVSSLAISLNIPLSLAADWFVKDVRFSTAYLTGTALVLTAFVLINWDMARERATDASGSELRLLEEQATFLGNG